MIRLIRIFAPVLTALLAGMLVTMMMQQLFPAAADNASALSGVNAFFVFLCMVGIWRQDRGSGAFRTAGRMQVKGKWLPVFCAAAFAAGAAASVLAGRLMEAAGIYELLSNETQEELYRSAVWVQLLGPGLLVPAAEELTYRVLLYDRLRELVPRFAAMLIVSVLFAAGHGNWIQAIYAFPMSLLLSACYELCGSPAGPIAMHMGANIISIVIMAGV